jgi:hypothetical protein
MMANIVIVVEERVSTERRQFEHAFEEIGHHALPLLMR